MRKICNFLIKTTLLFLVVSNISCENDAHFHNEMGSKIIQKKVTFQEFKQQVGLEQPNLQFDKLDLLQQANSNLRTASNNFIKIIHTQEIVYFELENGMTSYTMRATTNLPDDEAYTNIIYYSQNGIDFDYKVVRYYPEQGWTEQYAASEGLVFNGTVEGYSSEEVNLSGTFYARTGTVQCPIGFAPIWICNDGNAHSPDDYASGRCVVGGNVIAGYNTLWGDCPGSGGENSGGGGNDGGGNENGGGSGNNPNPGQELIEIPTKPIIITPIIDHITELNKIINLNYNVRSEVDDFKDNLNYLMEQGVEFNTNSAPFPAQNNVYNGVNFFPVNQNNPVIRLHKHHNELHPVFSAEDILGMVTFFLEKKQVDENNAGTISFIMVSKTGLHAFRVSNTAEAEHFSGIYPTNNGKKIFIDAYTTQVINETIKECNCTNGTNFENLLFDNFTTFFQKFVWGFDYFYAPHPANPTDNYTWTKKS